jgi:NACHT domain
MKHASFSPRLLARPSYVQTACGVWQLGWYYATMVPWLLGSGLGPALVSLPVTWAGEELARAAQRWFRRFRRTDDLSRLIRSATGTAVELSDAEFDAIRRLLENRETWIVASQGTVDDLAFRIASCLPPRESRSAEESHYAAMVIARGLLEFAISDLEPKLFQQLLLVRLQRMENNQANALDHALFSFHADLIARIAAQGKLDAQYFVSVMAQLDRMLDRLPPGTANRGEIAVYLKTLIDWLRIDPWPQDRRFGGPPLTADTIERKLRIVTERSGRAEETGADELVKQSQRLVILGDPGSGKTWLARRIVRRCAQNALEALSAGATLDEVELPLYTTCSRLCAASGDIREATVSSSLEYLGDIGGSRLNRALRAFFTERNAPTVLVLDSLDEAHGPDQRLRQADTLPWRIVLTSRPNSWNRQIIIDEKNNSHCLGRLQPLCYPHDVEHFIRRWFVRRPAAGEALVAQIADRPSLQQASTVPLILAFYCIVSTGEPLPDFRRDLYTRVLKRLLTGGWRGNDDTRRPDVSACLRALRAWAWCSAVSDPVSGIGMWADDIPTGPDPIDIADRDALDHIATPLGPPNVDTGMVLRRFIHRSIREHLCAEHIADLPVEEAAQVLLTHLWYDRDWEYVVPTAIAMHAEHDHLLRSLIGYTAQPAQVVEDFSAAGPHRELQNMLSRVADESSEDDWSPEMVALIHRARVELARSGQIGNLGGAARWRVSNRKVSDTLIRLLASRENRHIARFWVRAVLQLATTADGKSHARAELLKLIRNQTDSEVAEKLAGAVAQLDPTLNDRRKARAALLKLIRNQTDSKVAGKLAESVVQLSVTAADRREVRQVLLNLLMGETKHGDVAGKLADSVVQLSVTAEDRREVRQVLLNLLIGDTAHGSIEKLTAGIVQVSMTAKDRDQARRVLINTLADKTLYRETEVLVEGIVQLGPTIGDKRRARHTLLRLLSIPIDDKMAAFSVAMNANEVLDGMFKLDPTAPDKRQACQVLLKLLASRSDIAELDKLVTWIVKLNPTARDRRQARQALLGWLADQPRDYMAGDLLFMAAPALARGLVRLADTAYDKRQTRQALLMVLAGNNGRGLSANVACALAQLDPTTQERRKARNILLDYLTGHSEVGSFHALVDGLARLDPTTQDRRKACKTLLGFLADPSYWWAASAANGLAQLGPRDEDKNEARKALIQSLAQPADDPMAALGIADRAPYLVNELVKLGSTADEKRQARESLIRLLSNVAGHSSDMFERESVRIGIDLIHGLSKLDPSVRDLSSWRGWVLPPTTELLTATRANSPLTAWLAALPPHGWL